MINRLLQQYNIRPSKRLGQNFLVDKSVLRKIIQAAELKPDDVVLEIGPGLGILTMELAKHVKKIISVEKDKKMVEVLRNILDEGKIENVEVIEGDVRKYPISNIQYPNSPICHPELDSGSHKILKQVQNDNEGCSYKLIANIPYYLTSPLIRKFLETENQPELIVLMIQKEVAQRICAKPPNMSLLSIAVQFCAEPKIISYVSKKSFWPQPKVDSAIIKISPIKRVLPHKYSRITPSCFLSSLRGPSTQGLSARNEALPKDDLACAAPTRLPRPGRTSGLAMTKEFHARFFTIVRAGFAHPRKQIINNLSTGLKIPRPKIENILLRAGVNPSQRPSELSVDMWIRLCGLIVNNKL